MLQQAYRDTLNPSTQPRPTRSPSAPLPSSNHLDQLDLVRPNQPPPTHARACTSQQLILDLLALRRRPAHLVARPSPPRPPRRSPRRPHPHRLHLGRRRAPVRHLEHRRLVGQGQGRAQACASGRPPGEGRRLAPRRRGRRRHDEDVERAPLRPWAVGRFCRRRNERRHRDAHRRGAFLSLPSSSPSRARS